MSDLDDIFGIPTIDRSELAASLLRRILTPASWRGIRDGTNKKYWLVNGKVERRPEKARSNVNMHFHSESIVPAIAFDSVTITNVRKSDTISFGVPEQDD